MAAYIAFGIEPNLLSAVIMTAPARCYGKDARAETEQPEQPDELSCPKRRETEKEENLLARSPGNDRWSAHGFEHCSNVDCLLP